MHNSIYCDETWTSTSQQVALPCYVFYGVLLSRDMEKEIIDKLRNYKESRGLVIDNKYVEIKWVKADEEAKSAKKTDTPNRYMQYLDIFFDYLRKGTINFGYLYISKSDYSRVEPQFTAEHESSKHDFFFMLYFQFLYHCFIKNQTKQNPVSIFIDKRNMGADGVEYDVELLRACLNKRLYTDLAPKMQLPLSQYFRRQLETAIQIVSMEDSKYVDLIQLSDLCGGCVRCAIETEMKPPGKIGQLPLFGEENQNQLQGGKEELAKYFYQQLRQIDRYKDIQLAKPSYHHRFSIFPFTFT